MKRKFIFAAGALSLCIASSGFAQTYPSDGFIGVYGDAAHTMCCVSWPPGTPSTLHVYASLAGATAGGITGAEFRLIFDTTGIFGSWANDPLVALGIGSPIDPEPANPDNPYGTNLAFSNCQGTMAGDFVKLGTYSGFNSSNNLAQNILVTKRLPPSNPDPSKDCPQLILCDAPFYTQVCLTITASQLPPPQTDPIIFRTGLNQGANCVQQEQCGVVAVAPRTWSSMRELYR